MAWAFTSEHFGRDARARVTSAPALRMQRRLAPRPAPLDAFRADALGGRTHGIIVCVGGIRNSSSPVHRFLARCVLYCGDCSIWLDVPPIRAAWAPRDGTKPMATALE